MLWDLGPYILWLDPGEVFDCDSSGKGVRNLLLLVSNGGPDRAAVFLTLVLSLVTVPPVPVLLDKYGDTILNSGRGSGFRRFDLH